MKIPALTPLIRSVCLTIGFALVAAVSEAQVINFDVPGGVGGAVSYSGQGAYSDPGNNYWNAVVTNAPYTTSGGLLSDGASTSPITLTAPYGAGGGAIYTGDAQGANGTPSGLFAPFEDNKNSTFNTNTLNNVPAGTYNLYLYGNNGTSDSDRGTTFTVWTTSTSATSLSTANVQADFNTFVKGVNYVVFSNIVVGASGVIDIAWTGNTAATNIINPQTEGISQWPPTHNFSITPVPSPVISFDVPGGVSSFVNYTGQGAVVDTGNYYWNTIVGNGTTSSGLMSDGFTASPITLTGCIWKWRRGSVYTGDGQGAPTGHLAGLFSPHLRTTKVPHITLTR